MKQPLPRAFIGLDGAGGMTTVVLDETGSFSATENFVAVPATSLRVEEISTGARLIEIDLSGQALNNKFYADKIRSQALQFTKHTTDMADEFGHRVIGTTSELGKKVASEIGHRVTETTSDLRKKADSAIGPKAVETATVLGKKAADKAAEIGHKVGETISAISKQAADSPIGHKAIETASELSKKTAEMVATLARKTFEKGTLAQQSTEGQREEKAATTTEKGKE